MLTPRFAEERGAANFGWLDTRHTFSFGHYYDPRHMGFGPLRVINEDHIRPAAGFPTHGHNDMEIVTYIVDGALEHKDSTGTGSVIRPGDVQRMTAGTGIRHSEFNASQTVPVHLLQIWILPEENGLAPGYEEKHFATEEKRGRLRLIASRDGRQGSLTIRQDVDLFGTVLDEGETVTHETRPERKLWMQLVWGTVEVNGHKARAGDGLAIENESRLAVAATSEAELLLFDMTA
jgi:redox-sensitive bicupin YhaK (pirin superfamily)